VPPELAALLEGHPETRGVELTQGWPEKVVKLDDFRGEHRNADLVLKGTVAGKQVVISIEAKADEPFGNDTVAEHLANVQGARSNVPERVFLLCHSLFGTTYAGKKRLGSLRYQLLTATAGALVAAKNAELAVFVVHEFLTEKARPENVQRNRQDLDAFLAALLDKRSFHLTPGKLHGPINVHGGLHVPSAIPLFVGEIVRDFRG